MEDKLENVLREFSSLKRDIAEINRNVQETRRELADIKREVGAQEGRVLSEQINNLEKLLAGKDDLFNHLGRDMVAIRKLVEYNEINVKEIMKALALIYRSVDELEEEILSERKTT